MPGTTYVLDFSEFDATAFLLVGGKGANLGELSRIHGITVPPGFCVTTRAYREIVTGDPAVAALLTDLATVTSTDPGTIGPRAAAIRQAIESLELPTELRTEIEKHLARYQGTAMAVRSSATAEDLPQASFAGQQDTYLNVPVPDGGTREAPVDPARQEAPALTDAALPGGDAAAQAIGGYLDKFGVRCAGEIDITRPRWIEQPSALAPMILDDIHNTQPGAHKERYERGLAEYQRRRDDILTRLGINSGRAKSTAKMIDTVRAFAGFREYPKHAMMLSYWAIKRALLREADALVRDGAIGERDDIFFLTLDELCEVSRTRTADTSLIEKRKGDFEFYQRLTPPRVMTSDGEILNGTYEGRQIPPGALAGIAVSSGVVEGTARVVTRLDEAAVTDGDILVTPYTDPSWTPVFVSVKGLVTEVGGVATHGSVIAREYGLPAVVGVQDATTLIQNGRRIRVDGTEGWVQLL